MPSRLLLAPTLVVASALTIPAAAQSTPTVTVEVPGGQTLTLPDEGNYRWRNDPRLSDYDRFYYDTPRNLYVVYSSHNPPAFQKEFQRKHPEAYTEESPPAQSQASSQTTP